MKLFRLGMLALVAVVAVLGFGNAYAFHAGGVAECIGCHSMHSPAANGTSLLIANDPSSTCLSCHESATDTGPSSYHISTASGSLGAGQSPLQRTPGGDFGWLKKNYTMTIRGTTSTEGGQTHGHNIVAADKGYVPDPDLAAAPGGTYPSTALGCNSCHDPHGSYRRLASGTIATTGAPIKASGSYTGAINEPDATGAVGVYRLLAGPGYQTDGVTFLGVPAAKVPSSYNRTEAVSQVRTSYGVASAGGHSTWGNWCGTCHPDMHSDGEYVHPVDQSLLSTATTYGQYVKSGDMTGSLASSYNSLVPFAKNTADYTVLAGLAVNDNSQLGGPTSGDKVMCLSCHRAHASGFPEMLRWQMEGEFIVYNSLYPGTDTTPSVPQFARGRLGAETAAAYYDRPVTQFATYQRVLCNKCHAKD